MTMYVHFTQECHRDASSHGLMDEIERLKEKIEVGQKLIGFEVFRPTVFSKKGFGRSFRLLAYDFEVSSGDRIIFFLRVFPRSSSEYEWFLKNYQVNRMEAEKRFFKLNQEQIESIYTELTENSIIEKLQPPSAEEEEWLNSVFSKNKNNILSDDILILESREWVRQMLTLSTRDYLALYHKFLENIDISELPPSSSNTDIKSRYDESKEIGAIYIYRLNYLFLLSPILSPDEVAIQNKINDYISDIKKIESTENNEDRVLLRLAIRSYPYFMIVDREAWLDIQKDEEANLSLSPEEGDLLESIRRMDRNNEGFPLFINGRAGSGKSTMLQYLAADYIEFSLKHKNRDTPLYMTYSADLLRSARSTVVRLLKSHYTRFLGERIDLELVEDIVEKSFVVFHDYLYSLLSSKDQQRFSKGQFINYAEFFKLWNNDFSKRPESRKVSVDLAWHVLRSYIKGNRSSLDDELTPEEFASLPKKRQSVSEETYEFIYKRVWQSWYQRICEQGYWDDQDLVAAVLNSDILNELSFPAIFCDEAQDFTPIELELIIQLSLFSKRDLRGDQVQKVPFIFAGDPLQTLNPTGFRWENIQADFYDRFSNNLESYSQASPTINYKELKFNYRSNPGIVNFCNLIQLLRIAIIGEKNIQPQEAWWVQKPVQTVWCDIDDLKNQDQLKQSPEIIKIVNCDIGEETVFVDNDPILLDLANSSEGVYRNILSPGRSKGLEFSRVVLYKFGELAPDGFEKLLNGDLRVYDNAEIRLPYEYFLNRLYVAASRAKDQLVILDSREAIQKFWRFATDSGFLSKFACHLKNLDLWNERIAYLIEGNQESWTGEPIDIRQQALDYEVQGNNSCDPYLLKQASLSYKSIGEKGAAIRCLSKALELEGRYEEAGDICRDARTSDDAFTYYWKGECFDAICELVTDYPSLSVRVEARAAQFISKQQSLSGQFFDLLSNFSNSEEQARNIVKDKTWKRVILEFSSRIKKVPENADIDWGKTFTILNLFDQSGLKIDDVVLGQLACRARRYREAVSFYENVGQLDVPEYRLSKAETTIFPQNIVWYGKLRSFKKVLDEFDKHSGNPENLREISREAANYIAEAALVEGNLESALRILELYPDQNRLEQLTRYAAKQENLKIGISSIQLVLGLLARSAKWEDFLDVIENKYFTSRAGNEIKELNYWFKREEVFQAVLKTAVYELATSEMLPREVPEVQAPISEFLFQKFIASKPYQSIRESNLSIIIVGAAIERSGKLTNAVQFYESMLRFRNLDRANKKFVVERCIKTLEKYSDYLREANQSYQAEDRLQKAQELREKYNLGNSMISEFPELLKEATLNTQSREVLLSPNLEIQQDEWEIGSLQCKLTPNREKLKVENQDSFERVILTLKSREMQGDVEFSIVRKGKFATTWLIEEWNTTISIDLSQQPLKVFINCSDGKLEIPLE